MMKIPECLSRRYKALDDIIQELSLSVSSRKSLSPHQSNTSNVGIKLMCDFWNILKEDPDCNLTEEVQQRMGMTPDLDFGHSMYGVQRYITYMADKCCKDGNKAGNKSCGKSENPSKSCGAGIKEDTPKKKDEMISGACCSGTKSTQVQDDRIALSKVLCNLKEAATFGKKCHERVKDLMEAQELLRNQIQVLEAREKDGMQLLKEADCMWLCMENAYKKKVAESQERQQLLIKQLKEIDTSSSKWRKNKKELEFQINNITKARMEILEKINQKKNDLKIMDTENHNLTRRIESAKKDLENSSKSIHSVKEASDARMVNLTAEMGKIQKRTTEEKINMKKKEEEGTQYVKDARTDLQNICKVLLQKKLENEDLRAEKTAILEEIDLLISTLDNCKDKCKNKEESVFEELKTITTEIATFEAKCQKCHICTDTNDVRKLCTDCPKCLQERKCNVDNEECTSDPMMDCVCMSVKQKFLDNVFDNMYTVLERQSRTQPGKALADAILKSLRRSTNGKLLPETRRILQEFILSTVKKNLNLTIVGGAVKTRCELDPDTYKQLMTCLKSVKAVKPAQADKGILPKKDPCKRWGASSECNCPKGPKNCICTRKAPPPPDDPRPCPQDKEDIGEQKICPYRDKKVCGPDCGMQGRSSHTTRDIGNEIAMWRPDPCSGPSCPYNKVTRAALAQCVLGNESMAKTESRKTFGIIADKLRFDFRAFNNSLTKVQRVALSLLCSAGVSGFSTDTKHVKANLEEYCDKYTSVQRWGESQKDVRFELPCEKQFNLEEGTTGLRNNKHYVNSIACQINNLEQSSTVNSLENILSKQLKIVIALNNSGQSAYQSTILTKSTSGTFKMELDEQIIESLQKIPNGDPVLFVSLKKSNSGCLVVHFDSNNNEIANSQKVALRKTQSGTTFLEIHKNIIDIIENSDKYNIEAVSNESVNINEAGNNISESSFNSSTYMTQDVKNNTLLLKNSKDVLKNRASDSDFKDVLRKKCGCIILTHASCGNCNNSLDKNDEYEIIDLVTNYEKCNIVERYPLKVLNGISKVCESTSTEKLQDYSSELQYLFEQGNVKIRVQIQVNNKIFTKFETIITRSLAGTIGADLVQLASLGHIPLDGNEYPVTLSKTISNTYIVNIDQSSETFNAVLKKSMSGNVMLLPTTPQVKIIHSRMEPLLKLFKLKVKYLKNCYVEPPAVLKLTQSNNFIIVLDKEFETRYKKMVYSNFLSERQRLLLLQKTPSSYIIDLNTEGHIPAENLNALLVESESGNIKILVQGPVSECLEIIKTKRSPVSSAEVLQELLEQLHLPSTSNTQRKKIERQTFVGQKFASDTQLYERVKVKLKINKTLACTPSAILKKTESGHYAVILDKESKKTFLKNLRTFLVSNPKGLVPITRTESGEIQINLNHYGEETGHYGVLKITLSGNVYVVVDAEAITTMSNNLNMGSKRSNAVDTRSFNLEASVNKEVSTTCDGKPVNGICDVSKCVCDEMPYETLHWKIHATAKDTDQVSQPMCWEREAYKKPGTTDKALMKPVSHGEYQSTERCCYVFDTVCSYHNDKYEDVSNEFLCNSEFNKGEQKRRTMEFKTTIDLEHPQVGRVLCDSLNYLPPQLPPFLRNVRYR